MRSTLPLGALVASLLTLNVAAAQEVHEPLPVTHFPAPTAHRLCLDGLLRMSRCELEQLYTQSLPGTVPDGYARGRAIFAPGTRLTVPMSKLSHLFWQGKTFSCPDGLMVNKVLGCPAGRAEMYLGESWLDGRPAIILDYADTARLAANVRDEIREVAPGLYLGVMYKRKKCERKFVMFFALEAQPHCGCEFRKLCEGPLEMAP